MYCDEYMYSPGEKKKKKIGLLKMMSLLSKTNRNDYLGDGVVGLPITSTTDTRTLQLRNGRPNPVSEQSFSGAHPVDPLRFPER
jgi:hypothetical protein